MHHQKHIVGGAVPLLRDSIVKDEQVLGGRGIGANKIVGVISPSPSRNAITGPTKSIQTAFQGGELLKNLHFTSKRGREDGNIKFLF